MWVFMYVCGLIAMSQRHLVFAFASPMDQASGSAEQVASHNRPFLNVITCMSGVAQYPVTNVADCKDALALMPTVQLYLHPEPQSLGTPQRPNLYRNPPGEPDVRTRHHDHIPETFRSGSCEIIVAQNFRRDLWNSPHYTPRPEHNPLKAAASALYYTVWPTAQRRAADIIKRCLWDNHQPTHGYSHFMSALEGKRYYFSVIVQGIEPTRQQRTEKHEHRFKVYDSGEHVG
jgi:hypothetical protein